MSDVRSSIELGGEVPLLLGWGSDYEKAPEELLQRLPPRQRRLMGDIGPEYGPADYFSPKDQLEIILAGIE